MPQIMGGASGAGTTSNPETIKFDTGTTEGTDLYTFDGSAAKTIDIKAGTNVTLAKAAGAVTINASGSGGGGLVLGSATPLMDGVAAVGNSASASHENHVHPTDTSKANVGTTIGSNMLALTNPSALSVPRFNADNTVTAVPIYSVLATLQGFTETVTAGATTTLTVASTPMQQFTGTQGHTIRLPVTSTLTLGHNFWIDNNSTQNVIVESSGANQVIIVPPNTAAICTCRLTSGTTAASWDAAICEFMNVTGTGGVAVTQGSPTVTTPTIDGIVASGAAAVNALWAANATGSITVGAGLTTGALNIAAAGTGATPIAVGHTNATTTFAGTVALPTSTTKVGQTFLLQGGAVNATFPTAAGTLVGSGDTGTIVTAMLANSSSTATGVTYAKMQYVSAQYRIHGRITAAAGVVEELTPDNVVTVLGQATATTARQGTGAVVLAASPVITTPTIDGVVSSAAGATNALWAATTTGSITVGAGLTTGALNLAAAGTSVTSITIGHTNATIALNGTTTVTGKLVTEEYMIIALSDEATAITTGTAKFTMRAPFAMTLTSIPRAYLSTASTSGNPTVDINEAGVTVLGANKLSIDANEKTSVTAATATTLADTAIADDAELTFDIDTAGTGAKGLKVVLYYKRA